MKYISQTQEDILDHDTIDLAEAIGRLERLLSDFQALLEALDKQNEI